MSGEIDYIYTLQGESHETVDVSCVIEFETDSDIDDDGNPDWWVREWFEIKAKDPAQQPVVDGYKRLLEASFAERDEVASNIEFMLKQGCEQRDLHKLPEWQQRRQQVRAFK